MLFYKLRVLQEGIKMREYDCDKMRQLKMCDNSSYS